MKYKKGKFYVFYSVGHVECTNWSEVMAGYGRKEYSTIWKQKESCGFETEDKANAYIKRLIERKSRHEELNIKGVFETK